MHKKGKFSHLPFAFFLPYRGFRFSENGCRVTLHVHHLDGHRWKRKLELCYALNKRIYSFFFWTTNLHRHFHDRKFFVKFMYWTENVAINQDALFSEKQNTMYLWNNITGETNWQHVNHQRYLAAHTPKIFFDIYVRQLSWDCSQSSSSWVFKMPSGVNEV